MFLSELKLWNFRKYGQATNEIDIINPNLSIIFNGGLNLLIGENESGKSTIIDAIRLILHTQTYEYPRIYEDDFHYDGSRYRSKLRIECIFKGFSDSEAGQFLEWIGFNGDNEYELRVWLDSEMNDDNKIVTDIRAGADETGTRLDSNAANRLRITYLKPLRDAETEMSSGRRSRFAQLLKSHSLFNIAEEQKENHPLVDASKQAKNDIESYFKPSDSQSEEIDSPQSGEIITNAIKRFLNSFSGESKEPNVTAMGTKLWQILQQLNLTVDHDQTSLGVQNLLYMAAEMIMIEDNKSPCLRLVAVEELEAHLHPNYQMNVLRAIEQLKDMQFILTTHSTVVGTTTKLDNLIICKDKAVYPIRDYSNLGSDDKQFLSRFLEYTKANLFFCKGIIIVEGDSENLLVPAIAEIVLGRPLHSFGVSIVNAGSKALMRYAKIFEPKEGQQPMNVKVALLYDGDIPTFEFLNNRDKKKMIYAHHLKDNDYIISTNIEGFKRAVAVRDTDYDVTSITTDSKVVLQECHYAKYKEYMLSRRDDLADMTPPIFCAKKNEWTLEYSLARSCLKKRFLRAMQNAKIQSNNSRTIPPNEQDATKITQVFYGDNGLSKALTAQNLVKIVLTPFNSPELNERFRQMIISDPELSYIIEAIKFACGVN
ncbi:MAG: AAA family ATPase [Candidatus Cloacimonetes bacterium]|nr:AAA family ATPase [Candidatus Cloacimonadota bacterium]